MAPTESTVVVSISDIHGLHLRNDVIDPWAWRRVGVTPGCWQQGGKEAIHCARMGHDTVLWARSAATVDDINGRHENTAYLPGRPCPEALTASTDLEAVVRRSELLLLVVPTQYITASLGPVAHLLAAPQLSPSPASPCTPHTLRRSVRKPTAAREAARPKEGGEEAGAEEEAEAEELV
ncbi:Glycerol-3-phosphate dehydrogenase [NAD(P)+] [Tetrabaena socialis]|uniref:Glycerol-3-phosphate dehydrogenase [NAD(P)+] n=1 Tax=Tetrabaena socialis TaxID=47790 RepID=A0A2J7ZJN1_9CHLO|nr:Glycerol-3-phosphate dehydrogenase [NAD(P)+] [Tetrabaena socialis]|eukprot:PNH00467.1 Glycerol-3-phosphate dehydrogenase [NAD(P)+] [Tetrabaena socialis]